MNSLFVILALDGPDTADRRQQFRDAHLAHFRANADRLAVSGPLTGDVAGSLIVIETESAADAEAFVKADPFYGAGIFDRIEIHPFRASMGRWTSQ